MLIRNGLLTLCALSLVLAMPAAQAGDAGSAQLQALTQNYQTQVDDQLRQCASQQGLSTYSQSSIVTGEDSTAAFVPVAGVESLTREDFASWRTVGIFIANGPSDAEAPSGTFTVQIQAPLGSTNGEFQILSTDGTVVQSGDITITEDHDATPPTSALEQSFNDSLDSLSDKYHYGYCPWYYPYYYPYWFHYYPYYYYGCYWWHYRWWWGKFAFRYCWWPSRYCHHCCHW